MKLCITINGLREPDPGEFGGDMDGASSCDPRDPRATAWALSYDGRRFSRVKYGTLEAAKEASEFAEYMYNQGRRDLQHEFRKMMQIQADPAHYG